jgi:hypothetical protein
MRRLIVSVLLLSFIASVGLALPSGLIPAGIGAKYSAMGGAASAIVDDITCAYYNPAGIVKTKNIELKIGAGAANDALSQITSTFGNSSDPAKFLADNFGKTINISGGFNSIIGLNTGKVGLSIIPVAALNFQKSAGTIVGTVTGLSNIEGLLTLGYNFGVPMFPAGLNIGASVKSGNMIGATSTGTAIAGGYTSTDQTRTYSGVGFDIGATANLDVPLMPMSAAIVIKDIGETLKGKIKSVTTSYNSSGVITSQTTTSDTDGPDITIPATTVIGLAGTIPVYNVKVALDLDNIAASSSYGNSAYSVTHLGLEYPLLGVVALRAGMVTGGPGGSSISQTTLGAGFDLGAVINVMIMMDAKDSKNNSTSLDFGFAF